VNSSDNTQIESYIIAHSSDGVSVFNFTAAKQSIVVTPSKNEDKAVEKKWITSGTSDKVLNEYKNFAEKSTVIMPGLRFNAAMRFGGGIEYGKVEVVDGEKRFVPVVIDEIEEFFERNKIDEQFFTSLLDLETFFFSVAQLGKNLKGDKIVRLTNQFTRASWCRFQRRDNQGNIPNVFVNADFGTGDYQESNTKPITCAPEFIEEEWFENFKKGNKKEFAVVCRNPDLGRNYYPVPDWYTSIESGWYDIAQLIAEAKKFMFKNQFAVKYHIKINPRYWEAIYGKEAWAKFSDKERSDKKKQELDRISSFCQGTENFGATFYTETMYAHETQKFEGLIEFDELKNDFSASGAFMKESNESSDHMLSSLLIHPDIIGNAPGSTLGSGSGSGNRVAFNQRVALSLINQMIALEPLRIVSRYNKWGVKFMVRNSLITTLDTGASATKPQATLPTT
jgi:hypothetical protein